MTEKYQVQIPYDVIIRNEIMWSIITFSKMMKACQRGMSTKCNLLFKNQLKDIKKMTQNMKKEHICDKQFPALWDLCLCEEGKQ